MGSLKQVLGSSLQGYTLACTAAAVPSGGGPTAGVLVAVRKEGVICMTLSFSTPSPTDALAGHYVLVDLDGGVQAGGNLRVIGTYMPCESSPGAADTRQALYAQIRNDIDGHPRVVLAGDMNACYYPGDGGSTDMGTGGHSSLAGAACLKPHDRRYRDAMTEAGLAPVDAWEPGQAPCARTYRRQGLGGAPCSRIDDILSKLPTAACGGVDAAPWAAVHSMLGSDTDHEALVARLPWTAPGLQPPIRLPRPPRGAPVRVLQLPMSASDRDRLGQALSESLGPTMAALEATCCAALAADVVPHNEALANRDAGERHLPATVGGAPAAEWVNEKGTEFTELLQAAQQIPLEVCTTKLTNPGGRHFRPRSVQKRWKRCLAARQGLAELKRQCPGEAVIPEHLQAEIRSALGRRTAEAAAAQQGSQGSSSTPPPAPDMADLGAVESALKEEMRRISNAQNKAEAEAKRKQLTRQLKERAKATNKKVLGTAGERPECAMRVLHNMATGKNTADPAQIVEIAEEFGKQQAAAPGGCKTGKYLPAEATRGYPFATPGAPDGFQLALPCQQGPGQRTWLHEKVADEVAFQECVRSLARSKAPGPDGVTTEVLQALPAAGIRALHTLFQTMWAAGHTPDTWKESRTVLLYQKASPLLLPNYKRVGLEDTMYKLWTRVVTYTMVDFSERAGVLSSNQWGFRPRRGTLQPLEMLVMALEDAMLFSQNIYLLMVDFSAAFDTIDQDKLLMIMYDLGFPTDAIDVVRNLYDRANTTFQTPGGATGAVPIDRGTIQGEGLSPFLFALYPEPLLRWLHVGERGYVQKCLTRKGGAAGPVLQDHISSCTYADDLNLLAEKPDDLQRQSDKVTAYADWGSLLVNTTKTCATAALHQHARQAPYNAAQVGRQLGGLTIQRSKVRVAAPRDPFSFLGVRLTMDLNWAHQRQEALATVRLKAKNLVRSRIPGGAKLHIIETCLRPSLAYGLALVPYNCVDLKVLTSVLNTSTKQAVGLTAAAPSAMAQAAPERGGMGCNSLQVEAAVEPAQRLVRCLNDEGTLGRISRALLRAQLDVFRGKQVGGREDTPARPAWLLQYAMQLRRLQLANATGLVLTGGAQDEAAARLGAAVQAWLTRVGHDATAGAGLERRVRAIIEAIAPDLAKLWAVGVDSLADLLDSSTGTARPLQAVRNRLPSGQKMTAAQNTALLHVTRVLHAAAWRRALFPATQSGATRAASEQKGAPVAMGGSGQGRNDGGRGTNAAGHGHIPAAGLDKGSSAEESAGGAERARGVAGAREAAGPRQKATRAGCRDGGRGCAAAGGRVPV